MKRTIDTDPAPGEPRPSPRALFEASLTGPVIGAFYDVYNALGHGFLESVYTAALCREIADRGLRVEREVPVDVRYKGETVGVFRADMLIDSRLLVEVKATPTIVPAHRRQLLNYLRSTRLGIGLLLCFGQRAAFQRVIATDGASADPR